VFSPKLGDQVIDYIQRNTNYPPSLLKTKESGQVTLKFEVNLRTGIPESIEVSSSPNELMSKEAIRALKMVPAELLKGFVDQTVKRQVNITFNLK